MSPSRPFIVPVFLPGAGCPHRCVFCDQRRVTGVQGPLCSTDTFHRVVRRFLGYRHPRRRPVQVSFYGGNFLGIAADLRTGLLAAAQGYVRRGEADGIRFSTRPDTVDDAALTPLENFTVDTVEIGAQSMDDRVLHRCRRGHTAADTERAVGLLKRRGYRVGVQMMAGLPGDTAAGAESTARRIAGLAPDFVRIYPTLVFRDSPLARWYRDGDYRPLSLESAVTLVKRLYRVFARQGIPVVRMGLQASEEPHFSASLLAGPFHPAFGHLVHAEIFLDRAAALLASAGRLSGEVTLKVHPRSLSRLVGERGRNPERLKRRFGLDALRIVPDPALGLDEVAVEKG